MLRKEQFLAFYRDIVAGTEVLFGQVPPDRRDWRPVDTVFTLGQLMAHLAESVRVYADGVTGGEWGFTSMRAVLVANRHTAAMDPAAARDRLRENAAYFERRLSLLSDEDFEDGTVFAPQFNGPAPRWRVALLAAEHHLNHKAELFMCLKVLGLTLHTGHLYHLGKP